MRMSDWSSDVCSSDLARRHACQQHERKPGGTENNRLAKIWLVHQQKAHESRQPGGQRNDRQGPILAAQGKHPCQRDNEHRLQEFRWLKTERIASQPRSEEHTSELQSLMRISYAVFCLKKKKKQKNT